MKRIKLKSGEIEIDGVLNETKTAEEIWGKLPVESKVSTWGNEIYFTIPVKLPPENPRVIVDLGDLGYWMPGAAFCIFYGKTPSSQGDEIRPASPVNVFGKIDMSKIDDLKKIRAGETITISKAE